ncbi:MULTISPECIES: polysaccharide deacetylase family protein [Rhizobium]|uniref:polysaccharide deacetylase family protein n=1 Tax=Rhizobium TaxID=379 RepID=UPI0003753552|nr:MULTISPECIES: polysaccharide deacetylase family protein [Rhizobium]ASR10879.1 polysaccharide deacetylase [Rhizobium leguminosarum bv. viciae]KAF5882683.1 polysaccharide deacetylase [Rhizobium sp. PEPV16]MBY5749951.1 polysaccharide deacetylase [Rhizobium leguminosarum]MBY5821670.1 polysaccharide deacetylase [Rhizobium leguminosarum]NKM97550.1 polysaccharide deacetylase [Rhizobium leguminosarum bv. viciae]
MTDRIAWAPLHRELDRWQAAGRVARLWLRDDDAVEPTPDLETLLALTGECGVPLALAVIPGLTGEALAARLAEEAGVAVAVHGWCHTNHAGPERKKQELGGERPADVVLGELGEGFRLLQRLHPARFLPVLVPPWNRIDTALIPALPGLGFAALSVYGRAKQDRPMPLLNTHVDIIDWHGTRGGRRAAELVTELVAELDDRFAGSDEPIGVLTHHLVHDAAAWDFLSALFATTGRHPAVRWSRASTLLKAQAREPVQGTRA